MNYKKIYDNIINYRKNNEYKGYTECHHILPRSLGGSNDKTNLVNLSAREHYICHLLLTKMYEKGTNEYYKSVHAFMMMCNAKSNNQERDYKINSKIYEKLKIDFSLTMSKSKLGENNSQFKTFWIYNPTLKINMNVRHDHIIEDGWIKGRVMNWEKHQSQLYCRTCNKKGLKNKNTTYCSVKCKPKKEKNLHSRTKRSNDLKNVDWLFLLNIYNMYGLEGVKILCNIEFTSRNNFLMKCKRELKELYFSNQKTKKVEIIHYKC